MAVRCIEVARSKVWDRSVPNVAMVPNVALVAFGGGTDG